MKPRNGNKTTLSCDDQTKLDFFFCCCRKIINIFIPLPHNGVTTHKSIKQLITQLCLNDVQVYKTKMTHK